MQEVLNGFVEALKRQLGDKLKSVILYGSAVKGGHSPKHSDANLLVVAEPLTVETLQAAEEAIFEHRHKANLNPVFWSPAEILASADVFPVDFTDIRRHYQVLYGADPFKKLAIGKKNFQHQMEFELRSKLLRLRSAWFELRGDRPGLEQLLGRAGTSLRHLLNECRGPFNIPAKEFPVLDAPFEKCRDLRHRRVKMDREEMEQLFGQVHEAVVRLIALVEKG